MSAYFRKGRGWKFDFTLGGRRHTSSYYQTKGEARQAEARRREELTNPQTASPATEGAPTDMAFLELVNRRLDHVQAYNSKRHYQDHFYMARRWVGLWGELLCSQITQEMIERFVLARSKISACTANKEIRYLRATFNYGLKKRLIADNPTLGLEFLPFEKRIKYVPASDDINKVMEQADPDTQDYLWMIRDTMARVSEINRLTWDDVDLGKRTVVLYTRKKRGGHLTPRMVPLTKGLHRILSRRLAERAPDKPWVFWHRYWSGKQGRWMEGPYKSRHNLMKGLCEKAGVRHFGFHALRHAGASLLDQSRVPLGTIQRILGHENRSTTEIYLHSIGEPERAAMAVLEKAHSAGPQSAFPKNPHPNPHPNAKRRLRLVT